MSAVTAVAVVGLGVYVTAVLNADAATILEHSHASTSSDDVGS